MKNNSGIYKILNLKDNKFYIGSAVDLRKRFYEHARQLNKNEHNNRHLQFAWNKYWSISFKFEIIEIVEDKSKLLEREQFWIDMTNCCNDKVGYNLSPVAGSQLNFKHSVESKLKISLAAKNISQETRDKRKAYIFTDEHRKHMSIARKKRITKEETRIKLSVAGKNRNHTEQHKLNISKSKLGHDVSKETRLLISNTLKLRNRLKFKTEMWID